MKKIRLAFTIPSIEAERERAEKFSESEVTAEEEFWRKQAKFNKKRREFLLTKLHDSLHSSKNLKTEGESITRERNYWINDNKNTS